MSLPKLVILGTTNQVIIIFIPHNVPFEINAYYNFFKFFLLINAYAYCRKKITDLVLFKIQKAYDHVMLPDHSQDIQDRNRSALHYRDAEGPCLTKIL